MKIWTEEDTRAWEILKKDRARLTKLVVLFVISLTGLPVCVVLLTQSKPIDTLFVALVGLMASVAFMVDLQQLQKEAGGAA